MLSAARVDRFLKMNSLISSARTFERKFQNVVRHIAQDLLHVATFQRDNVVEREEVGLDFCAKFRLTFFQIVDDILFRAATCRVENIDQRVDAADLFRFGFVEARELAFHYLFDCLDDPRRR